MRAVRPHHRLKVKSKKLESPSFFLLINHTKKPSISAPGATLSTGTASAFSLAALSPGASARAFPVGVSAPSAPIALYRLLKKNSAFKFPTILK